MTKLGVLLTAWLTLVGCGGDGEQAEETSSSPAVVGCNSVLYQGFTYTGLGCEPGIASFNVTISQNGHTASFHIQCSGGCVSSASAR